MFLGSPACVVQVREAHLKPAASSSASSAGQRRHSAGDSSYTTRGVKILCSSSGTQKSVAKNDAAGPRGLASFDTPHHPTGRLPMSLPFMCRSTRSVTSVNSPSRREQPQQSRHPAHHGVMHSGLVVPLPLRPCAYTYAHLLEDHLHLLAQDTSGNHLFMHSFHSVQSSAYGSNRPCRSRISTQRVRRRLSTMILYSRLRGDLDLPRLLAMMPVGDGGRCPNGWADTNPRRQLWKAPPYLRGQPVHPGSRSRSGSYRAAPIRGHAASAPRSGFCRQQGSWFSAAYGTPSP